VTKHAVLTTGTAVAVTAALLNSLCAVGVALWPEESIRFANTWMHGLDLQMIKATAPPMLTGFLRGLIGIAAIGFITGVVYAWVYNQLHDFRRAQR
jgi:2TM family of unknown function (DUF5676)